MNIDEFIELHIADIINVAPGFSKEKNVIFREHNNEYIIKVPRNTRGYLSDILKSYYIHSGVSDMKQVLSSDRTTVIGYKSPDFKVSFKPSANKGDVTEGILGAGITARFITPHINEINESAIDNILDQLKNAYNSKNKCVSGVYATKKWSLAYDSLDEIHFTISMPYISLNALLFNRQEIKHLYVPVLAYINSKEKVDLIRDICLSYNGIYNNDRVDIVRISSMGTVNQRSTKVDVCVRVDTADGKQVDLRSIENISLKALSTKQLYQYGGNKIEKIQEFFSNIFGIELPDSVQQRYRDNPDSLSKINNLEYVLRYVSDEINIRLSSVNESIVLRDRLARGIRNGAITSPNNDKVIVVHLHKNDFSELDFERIHEKLQSHTLTSKYDITSSCPKIRIFAHLPDKEPKPLVVIRTRIDGLSTRIYLERETYLDELLTISSTNAEEATAMELMSHISVM